MTSTSLSHATFTIERTCKVPPDMVFRAWADPAIKRKWFVDSDGPGWETLGYDLDFREDGREHGAFRDQNQSVHANETVYIDIVPDRRIVFAYAMLINGKRHSASLATVELSPVKDGTLLTFTEQGAFFEGGDGVSGREGGWNAILDQLANYLTN